MSTEASPPVTSTTEAAPPAQATKSDDGKSGNLTAGQMAQRLLQRGATLTSPASSADQATPPVTPPAETASATPAPASEATPETTEETPAETVETPPADDAPEAEALSKSHALPPDVQAKIDKRIGKEVARRKAAEEEITRLRSQLSTPAQAPVQAAPATPTPDNPLGHVTDVSQLAQEQANIKEIKRWAQSQLVREDIDAGVEGYGRNWSKADLHQTILAADRVLEDQIPQRYHFLSGRAQAEKTAAEQFPWMKDKASTEYAEYQAAFRQYPWLNNLPDAPMVVAVQMAGIKALREQAEAKQKAADKAAKKPAPSTPPPASQTAVGAAPGAIRETQTAAAKKQDAAQVQALSQKGNVTQKDMARLLSQRELTSR